jgi:hypothetical protein
MFNKTTAYIAALALVTTTQFIYYSRAAMMDVSVTFFMVLSLYYYYKTFSKKDRLLNWVIVGVFLGLGGMIKNVVGFLPLLVIGVHEITLLIAKERILNKELWKKYASMAFSASVVFLPWHIAMFSMYGGGFINNYLIYHIITRGTSAIEQKGRPFFWYLIILKVSMRLWFIALLGAFPFGAIQAFTKKNRNHIFLLTWILVVYLFFSSAKSKIVWYIVPLYPVLAILVARFIERSYDWVITKVSWAAKPVAKSFFIYVLTFSAIFYLFLVRELVYTSDLTGAQATLLMRKDELYPLDLPLYVDKVELPLIKYYTEGEYVDTEYRALKKELDNPLYDETIIFLTKESRFEKYSEELPDLSLVAETGDFVLGILESQYERDLLRLEESQKGIKTLTKIFSQREEIGEVPTYAEQQEMLELKEQEAFWLQIIEVGLASSIDNAGSNN